MVCERIMTEGIVDSEKAVWKLKAVDLRKRAQELLAKVDLTTNDTRPSVWISTARGGYSQLTDGFPVVCACGDELGACYCAVKHNRTAEKAKPLIISFEVEPENVWLDGKDFLYNFVFQMGQSENQRDLALRIFGGAIDKYIEKAWASEDQDYRIAVCDMCVQDLDVVRGHYLNDVIIGGRHGTVFKSAFMVRLPIGPEYIVSVMAPKYEIFKPDITIDDYLSL